jgi:transposase
LKEKFRQQVFGDGFCNLVILLKKTFYHPKRDEVQRESFLKIIKLFDDEELVFIDESGIEDNACREYGWSLIKTRCYGEKSYKHNRRISMIAGLCHKKLIAPFIFEGTCDTAIFELYVEQVLIKSLKHGQTVVLDNISFHKTKKVVTLIESVGCNVLYLPTYSPDLNPIEHSWLKIKNLIRKTSSFFSDFFQAVSFVLNFVTT